MTSVQFKRQPPMEPLVPDLRAYGFKAVPRSRGPAVRQYVNDPTQRLFRKFVRQGQNSSGD
jgi:hypothetical protein